MDIKTFTIARFDMEYVLCWLDHHGYYIQALERGEHMEDFSYLPHQQLPETRNDAEAIKATQAYVDHVTEELTEEAANAEPTPNWEAQAHYDAMHGTVNGEDPNIARWKEEFGGEY